VAIVATMGRGVPDIAKTVCGGSCEEDSLIGCGPTDLFQNVIIVDLQGQIRQLTIKHKALNNKM